MSNKKCFPFLVRENFPALADAAGFYATTGCTRWWRGGGGGGGVGLPTTVRPGQQPVGQRKTPLGARQTAAFMAGFQTVP
jgi:hypothetical protein